MPAELRDPHTGTTHALDPARRLLIGRSRSADLRIASGAVAGAHARLEARPASHGVTWWVSDLGSTNGTFVNGAQIDQEGRALHPGDVIRVATERSLVFDHADAGPRADRSTAGLTPPADRLRQATRELLSRADAADGSAAREAHAANAALERLDRGDLPGAFEALLAELDVGEQPGALYVSLAEHLIAFSPERAGPVLMRRAREALDAGADALPATTLLAESGDDRSIFELRNHAGRLRDRGYPGAGAVVEVLARTPLHPWRNAMREHFFPQAREAWSDEERATLGERVALSQRLGGAPDDARLLTEVVEALRATPVEDVDKRAALGRMLGELEGRSEQQGGWLGR